MRNKKFFVKYTFEENNLQGIHLITKTDGEEIGFINFKFTNNDSVWLNLIKVHEKFQSQGYGDILIELFENYCRKYRKYIVEGKYYPENENAVHFYKKHDYQIDKEYYDQYIFKIIRENTKENTNSKINDEIDMLL